MHGQRGIVIIDLEKNRVAIGLHAQRKCSKTGIRESFARPANPRGAMGPSCRANFRRLPPAPDFQKSGKARAVVV